MVSPSKQEIFNEFGVMRAVVGRYAEWCAANGVENPNSAPTMVMLLDLVNMRCPLDFNKLLAFPDFDFAHDMRGMINHADGEGVLRDCFLPRCAKSTAPSALRPARTEPGPGECEREGGQHKFVTLQGTGGLIDRCTKCGEERA